MNAVDVWSPVTVGWAFGDGAIAAGASVSHAYGAPGTYAATATATDALGNAATTPAATVAVAAAPPVDRTAPALTGLKLSRSRFRAAASGGAFAAAATPVGARLGFTLSEAARVRFTVQRATTGRRVGGICRRTTKQNRARTRCTRYVAVKGSATRTGRKGTNRTTFRGRLGNRKLAAGRYRLLAQATDAAGNRSPSRRVAFRIVNR